jgi:hypothetical protein
MEKLDFLEIKNSYKLEITIQKSKKELVMIFNGKIRFS